MGYSHPVRLLPLIAKAVGPEAELEFGLYRYKKGSQEDERQIVRVKAPVARHIYESRLYPESLVSSLEVALQSRIWFPHGNYRHLLMADLLQPELRPDTQKNLKELFHKCGASLVSFFASGNSYHAYGIGTITDTAFAEVSGQMLLLRDDAERRIVDDRWIAHRLIAGYWALRLTYMHKGRLPDSIDHSAGEDRGISTDQAERR